MSPNDTTTKQENGAKDDIVEGPDLNDSRSPFDKKVYRQILLPNGLRAVLISDTVAMTQSYNSGGIYEAESFSDDDEDDDKEKGDKNDDGMEIDKDGDDNDGDDDDDDDGVSLEHGLRNAAASMVVGAGSMYDPPECQGLAHFLEHLLFMGSKKYPEENAYDAYMSKHGGSDNAFTELEHTVYHFEIPQENLAGALDMFAQFFTHPLLLENSVERELRSIESEFLLAKNSDSCRVEHLMCHTCGHSPSQHPFANFSWGNLNSLKEVPEALKVDPMEKLRTFYKKYYYASNMRLVVIGGYSLDYLQEHVMKSFSDIPSQGLKASWNQEYSSPMKSNGMPFTDACLEKIFYISPVKDRHSLSITWQVPSQLNNWKTKPCDFLAHLLGHEAKGSVLASLKAKSWATACCAGVGAEGYENASSHALFTVTFTLSEEGVANWRKIVSALYQYVGMLREHCKQGLPSWIYDELKSIQEVAHRYSDELSPEDLVETMAEELAPEHNLPPERLLDGTSLLFEYDAEKIKTLVDDFFTPSNARIDMSSTHFGRSADYETIEPNKDKAMLAPSEDLELFSPTKAGPPQQEPIFGTHYWIQKLSDSQLKEWSDLAQPQMPPADSNLSLPQQNQFVPTKFSLKPLPAADCDHPLLNCSIKLQITVGKRKQWFPATVTQYNGIKNQIRLSYEDEDEKWHKMDLPPSGLTPSNLTSPDFEGTLDSKKIKFRIVALAMDGAGAVRRFGDESDFDVDDGIGFPPIPPAASPSRLPKLVCNTNLLKLWHLQDRSFKRPIAELRLQLQCAEANKTPLYGACADILVHLVSDALTETAYMASVCELGSSLATNDGGFTLRVHGFDDKLLSLFLMMFELVMSFRGRADGNLPPGIQDGRFDLCLETYRRQCNNSGMKASKLSSNVRIRCIRPTSWSTNMKLKAIENLTISTFMNTIASILEKIGIEGLYHGNVDATDTERAQKEILELLQKAGGAGLPRKKYPHQFVFKLPESSSTLLCPSKDPTEPNSAVEVYFQVGKDKTYDRVMADLLMEMMYEPLYDQIRTKDQFGYSVSCGPRWTDGVIGMHMQVVTSSKTGKQAEDRIEKFLTDYRQTLVDMTPADFMEHLAGLAKQKLDMFNSLSEETDHFWSEIRDGRYLWEVEREEVLCLKGITKEQTLDAYDRWLFPGSKTRRRMAVQVISSEGDSSEGRPEVDAEKMGDYIDGCVKDFHKYCKNQTYGKIY